LTRENTGHLVQVLINGCRPGGICIREAISVAILRGGQSGQNGPSTGPWSACIFRGSPCPKHTFLPLAA
jgi:hypothetical protein